jgi:hypothetical protein
MLKKSAASGENLDTILLIVLVISLSLLTKFLIGSTLSTSPPDQKFNDIKPLVEEPVIEEPSLEDAIIDLMKEGCRVYSAKVKVYLEDPNIVNFDEFKIKALESKLLIISHSESDSFLLVQIKNEQWIWVPH